MLIQVNIGGFGVKNATTLAHYDEKTGILSILKAPAYSSVRLRDDIALVTNMNLRDRDLLLTGQQITTSIPHFFARKAQGMLTFSPELSRFDPENKIQVRSIGEAGQSYEISPDITNEQMSVLAAVRYADSFETNNAVADIWDDINGFSV